MRSPLSWVESRRSRPAAEHEIALLRQAIALRPDDAQLLIKLGSTLTDAYLHAEAELAFRDSLKVSVHPHALGGLGWNLLNLGRPEEAFEVLDRSIQITPDQPAVHSTRAQALYELGRVEEARDGFERALLLEPTLDFAARRYVELLFSLGQLEVALEYCDAALIERPGDTRALSSKVLTLRALGDHDRADWLVGADDYFSERSLDAPDNYSEIGAFNDALTAAVLHELPLREVERHGVTLNARKLLGLQYRTEPVVRDLCALIRSTVDQYVLERSDGASVHPFAANAPQQVELSAWTMVFGAEGFEEPHMHPSGWLSGVYYVSVADEPGSHGAIEFGVPPGELIQGSDPSPVLLHPRPGMCLLFPSYYQHRTVPPGVPERRISVAFDVRPVG